MNITFTWLNKERASAKSSGGLRQRAQTAR
jgi:hypothetical protein